MGYRESGAFQGVSGELQGLSEEFQGGPRESRGAEGVSGCFRVSEGCFMGSKADSGESLGGSKWSKWIQRVSGSSRKFPDGRFKGFHGVPVELSLRGPKGLKVYQKVSEAFEGDLGVW